MSRSLVVEDVASGTRSTGARQVNGEGFACASHRWRALLADVLAIAILLLITWKVHYLIFSIEDLRFDDEPSYIFHGMNLMELGLPEPQSSPLYSIWYFVWSRVLHDPVTLYFFNTAALSFLLGALGYALTRSVGAPRPVALVAACLLLVTRMADVSPYVMHLATAVAAAGIMAAIWCRTWSLTFVVLAVTFLAASYVRPEFGISFILLLVSAACATCVLLLKRRVSFTRVLGPGLAVLLIAAGLAATLGNTVLGGRPSGAFVQHYALNRVQSEGLAINPWYQAGRLFAEDFGEARTFPQAIVANPRAVLWHLGQNIRSMPGAFLSIMDFRLDFPPSVQSVLEIALGITAILCGVALFVRLRSPLDDPSRRRLLTAIGAIALACAPSVLAMSLIYPRLHYMLPVAFFICVVAASSLHRLPRAGPLVRRIDGWPGLVAVAVVLVVVAPNRANGWNPQQLFGWRDGTDPPVTLNLDIVQLVRGLPIDGPVAVFDADRATALFAGLETGAVVPMFGLTASFGSVIDGNDVDLVVLSPALVNLFPGDLRLEQAVDEMRMRGFALYPVDAGPVWVAVRGDRLREPAPEASPATPE